MKWYTRFEQRHPIIAEAVQFLGLLVILTGTVLGLSFL